MNYKERIKTIMRRKGMTQIELAEKLGKTVQNIRNTLSASNMTVSTLEEYAAAMGCDISEFFTDDIHASHTLRCPSCGAELELNIKH